MTPLALAELFRGRTCTAPWHAGVVVTRTGMCRCSEPPNIEACLAQHTQARTAMHTQTTAHAHAQAQTQTQTHKHTDTQRQR